MATFQPWDGTWDALDRLYDEFVEDPLPIDDRWNTDAQVEEMFTGAGFPSVRTETATYEVPFVDVEEFRRWSWATPLGGLWRRTPESQHGEILRRARTLLDASRDASGRIVLEIDARYSLAIA